MSSTSPTKASSHHHNHPQLVRSRTSSITTTTPVAVKPNAHPYAIKTTSTALLSRSSSSPHHSSTYLHYVPSPSPSPTAESPTKRSSGQFAAAVLNGHGNGHRYSRSMTDAPPRSLPLPPSRPSSVSPRKMGFLELEGEAEAPLFGSERTPRQSGAIGRDRRLSISDLGGSGGGDGRFRDMRLPEDPKMWDPPELATYLEGMISGENGGEVARFVREQRISGRVFLRLTERDLEEYAVDPRWALTFLEASRSLRQSTLRGRIWGFGNTPESAYNHPLRSRSDSLSSSDDNDDDSANDNMASNRPRRGGRVKGMVASFEQSSSSGSEQDDANGMQDMSRSRSVSPTKTSHRRLPQRPRVESLFGPPPPPPPLTGPPITPPPAPRAPVAISASPTREGYEDGSTLKQLPVNRNKELPRLLPFPPPPPPPPASFTPPFISSHPSQHQNIHPQYTGPSLTPSHTGAGCALPASPQPELGELGYKTRKTRMLPVPPGYVSVPLDQSSSVPGALLAQGGEQESVLYHPRPVRGGPVEIRSSEVDEREVKEEVKEEEEEPSMEELLARPGQSLSGVDAWEMDLGQGSTVKRVVANDLNHEKTEKGEYVDGEGDKTVEGLDVPVSPGEFVIGRTGRRARRVRPKIKGVEGGGSVRGLFDGAEPLPKPTADVIKKDAESQTDEDDSDADVLRKLVIAEEKLSAATAKMEEGRVRDEVLNERERVLGMREEALGRREREFEARVEAELSELRTRRQQLDSQEQQHQQHLAESQSQVEAQAPLIAAREKDLRDREEALEVRMSAVKQKEKELVERESTLNLARRLVGRVVGKVVVPVLGERVARMMLRPLGGRAVDEVSAAAEAERRAREEPDGGWRDVRGRGPYFVLLGVGVCAAVLRVFMRRVLLVSAVRVSGRVAGGAVRR